MRTCFRFVCTLMDGNAYSPLNDSAPFLFLMNFFHHPTTTLSWLCYSDLPNGMPLQKCGCTQIQLLHISNRPLNPSDVSYATFVTSPVPHFPLLTFQRKLLLVAGRRTAMQQNPPPISPINALVLFPFQSSHLPFRLWKPQVLHPSLKLDRAVGDVLSS